MILVLVLQRTLPYSSSCSGNLSLPKLWYKNLWDYPSFSFKIQPKANCDGSAFQQHLKSDQLICYHHGLNLHVDQCYSVHTSFLDSLSGPYPLASSTATSGILLTHVIHVDYYYYCIQQLCMNYLVLTRTQIVDTKIETHCFPFVSVVSGVQQYSELNLFMTKKEKKKVALKWRQSISS